MGARPRKFYDFAGQKLTIREIVERTGLEWSTVTTRVHCGKLPLDAPLGGYPVRYELHGECLTIKEWAAYWCISVKNARLRIDYYLRTRRARKAPEVPPVKKPLEPASFPPATNAANAATHAPPITTKRAERATQATNGSNHPTNAHGSAPRQV